MDLYSVETRRNPYPMYDQIREAAPVIWDPRSDMWMVFDYDNVKRTLTDNESFSSSLKATAGQPTPDWLIFMDPPRHTRLRALISCAFTPRVVAGMEPRIRELSRGLLDKMEGREGMDLALDYTVPLPMKVIAGMIGIPAEYWARFKRWSDVILNLSYTIPGSEEAAKATTEYWEAAAEMREYVTGVIEERRSVPTDDLLTKLVEAEVEGEHLTENEILGFFQLLLVAGNETTTNLINNAMLCLMENPDQLALLRARPELLPSAIEEAARFRAPIQWMFRATRHEVELGGKMIPAGKIVLPMIGAANRDPGIFPDAGRFDITRDPNPHIAFGHGMHFCLGAPLARLESRIALTDLLERMESFERASTGPWEPRKALHVHGPSSLPIRFQTGRQPAEV